MASDREGAQIGAGAVEQWAALESLILATLIVAVVAVVAVLVQRRRPEVPTQGGWEAPTQLDRADFDNADCPWLVAVFTSATCDSCADTLAKTLVLTSDQVAVQDVEVGARPDLHRRYGIDAVPIVVIADREGVVRANFVGPPSATDLWEAVARARSEAGSVSSDE